MDQSKVIRLKNRIWRRLSKALSKESVLKAANTIQRAATMFFGCGTKRYDIADEVSPLGVPDIWKSGATHAEIMEFYKKKIVILEDESIISTGGDEFPGNKTRNSEDEKNEPTVITEQQKHVPVVKSYAEIIQKIEDSHRQADTSDSEEMLTHTERWAMRIDHSKCCLGWDFVLGRRDCLGKGCEKADRRTSNSETDPGHTTEVMPPTFDKSDLTNPFLFDIIKEIQSNNKDKNLGSDLNESDLSNPFLLDMINERLPVSGVSAGDGIHLLY